MPLVERAVLTLAMKKPLYLQLAINLAKSFLFWNPGSDVRFFIATDQQPAPGTIPAGVDLLPIEPGSLPDGFSSKLHLDRIAPARRTLFIDADCLCFRKLDFAFDALAGAPVSVVGTSIRDGEWFGDVAALLRYFGLDEMPKFNGGLYYLEPGEKSTDVYEAAREVERMYERLNLVLLRGRPNDEISMAVGMALNGLRALPDDGTIIGDPQECPGDQSLDMLGGRARLENPPMPDPRHRTSYPLRVIEPAIVHFLGYYTELWPYRAEMLKLNMVRNLGLPPAIAGAAVSLTFSASQRAFIALKDAGRPLYRRLIGVRPIKVSERVVP